MDDVFHDHAPALPGIYPNRPPGVFKHEFLPGPDVDIDPRSPYAIWKQGDYLTRIPYIPDTDDPNVNALKTVSPLANFYLRY